MQFFRKMLKDSKGATAIEYGLIAALIAVAAITAMGSVGNSLKNTCNNVNTELYDYYDAGSKEAAGSPAAFFMNRT